MKEEAVEIAVEEQPKIVHKVVGVQNYKRKVASTLSINGLKNQKKEEREEEEQEDFTNKPSAPFTLEELSSKWKSYGYQLKKSGRQSLYVTLSKRIPDIKDNFILEFEVDNEVQKMEMESEKSSLLSYLRSELNNYSISLSILLTEKDDSIKHLTNKDKFIKMAEKNSALNQLREKLNLDIEY